MTDVIEKPTATEKTIYEHSPEYSALFQKQQAVEAKRVELTREEADILRELKEWFPSAAETGDRMTALDRVLAGEQLSSSPSFEKQAALSARLAEVRKALHAIAWSTQPMSESLALLRERLTSKRLRDADCAAARSEVESTLRAFLDAHRKAQEVAARLSTQGFATRDSENGGWGLAPELGEFDGEAFRWLGAGTAKQ